MSEQKETNPADKNKSLLLEIIRFLVVGVACTLIDFFVQFFLMKYAFVSFSSEGGENGWGMWLAWCLSIIIAFVISTIVNFVLSRIWVYKNVDKNADTKSQKAWWAFFFLGVGGLLIGLGLQLLGVLICNNVWPDLGLSYEFYNVSWSSLFQEGGLAFWAFAIIFILKTAVTMVYNYITRKALIFKKPKEEQN